MFKRAFGGGQAERRVAPRDEAIRGACILVVDDSPTICAVIGKMLTQNGHIVLKAGNGESALAIARSQRPDLIFLDIVMPGMSGFSVLRALRREPATRDIPVVMISGNLQATEQFYVQRLGADDFIKKPFGRGEVFARIDHLHNAGRLVIRQRAASELSSALQHSEHETASIPDVAMPDPEHMAPSAGTSGEV